MSDSAIRKGFLESLLLPCCVNPSQKEFPIMRYYIRYWLPNNPQIPETGGYVIHTAYSESEHYRSIIALNEKGLIDYRTEYWTD